MQRMTDVAAAKAQSRNAARVRGLLGTAAKRMKAAQEFIASNPPGTRLTETIEVAGPAANEIAARVEQLMAQNGCTSAVVGPSTYRFARTVRPGAMTASTSVASVLTLGLCLPLMFLRWTEECTVTIIEHPTGTKVTVVGRVPRPAVAVLRSELGARQQPAAASSPTSVIDATRQRESAAVGVADPPTTARPTVVDATRPRAVVSATPPTANAWLQFDTGERVEMVGRIVVGRAPDVPADQPDIRAVAIDDPARTVSKTHFRVFARDDVAWIEDMHSTNGTVVAAPGQPRQSLVPMQRATLVVGSRIEFGDRVVSVVF